MSTELAVPFRLAPDGGVAVVHGAIDQAGQHVEALCATGPGERVILQGYGISARNAVFAPDDTIATQILQTQITSAMQTWEPDLQIVSVQAQAQVGTPVNSAQITVNWSPRNVQNPVNPGVYQSTILIGGTVI